MKTLPPPKTLEEHLEFARELYTRLFLEAGKPAHSFTPSDRQTVEAIMDILGGPQAMANHPGLFEIAVEFGAKYLQFHRILEQMHAEITQKN